MTIFISLLLHVSQAKENSNKNLNIINSGYTIQKITANQHITDSIVNNMSITLEAFGCFFLKNLINKKKGKAITDEIKAKNI